MGRVCVNIPDALEDQVRRIARRLYGDKRGALKKAVTDALIRWVELQTLKEVIEKGR